LSLVAITTPVEALICLQPSSSSTTTPANTFSRKEQKEPQDLEDQTIMMMNDEYKETTAMLRLLSDAGVTASVKFTGKIIRIYERRGQRKLSRSCPFE
jgi:hypothetical protein